MNRLNSKEYTIFDKQFMAFGSIMNGLQGKLANLNDEQISTYIRVVWNLAGELVRNSFEEGEKRSGEDKKEVNLVQPYNPQELLEELKNQ